MNGQSLIIYIAVKFTTASLFPPLFMAVPLLVLEYSLKRSGCRHAMQARHGFFNLYVIICYNNDWNPDGTKKRYTYQ